MKKFFTNRLIWMLILICLFFYILIAKLYNMQIVLGDTYQNELNPAQRRQLSFNAPRGTIYDRYGRPLATNTSAFNIKIDPSIYVSDINSMLFDLVSLLEKNGEAYVDDFPISKDMPYEFSFDNKDRERRWKADMDVPEEFTATETLYFLRDKFGIDKTHPDITDSELRSLLIFRSQLYMKRFRQYQPITIAYDVSKLTITAIEEEKDKYSCVYADVEALREYPLGKYFANMLGYIGRISDKDLEDYKQYGYTANDLIGKSGIERAFELDLRGKPGTMVVEVNSVGKRLSVVPDSEVLSEQGDKIFLTIDSDLQIKAYDIFEQTLTEILVKKLKGTSSQEAAIPLKQLFTSMVKSNNISTVKIMTAPEGTTSYEIARLLQAEVTDEEGTALTAKLKEVLNFYIDKGTISLLQMTLVLFEQGIITGDDSYIQSVKSGRVRPLQVVTDKLTEGEITPQMTYLDPCTGSMIITDVRTGDVLAAVSYPAYDNNRLVNNFDNDYWFKINLYDPTTPMLNRPFIEPRAPGSTFKMITAIAGMETGAITPSSTIYDGRSFDKAGPPAASCYSSYSHGSINVATALEVSCNYFFFETAFRMGNSKEGTKYKSIDKLNEVMEAFGLGSRSGVEIGELADSGPVGIPMLASPEYKAFLDKRTEPNSVTGRFDWYDGDTIRTAIGQSINSYTPANMVKYGATLATKGQRYKLHLLSKKTAQTGEIKEQYVPELENEFEIRPDILNSVYNGMLAVTGGIRGTATHVFRNFPIRVAGKTGTAQQISSRNDHSSFIGFAPYDNPQIAIYVSIPFGDTKVLSAPAAVIAKRVLTEYFKLDYQPERKSSSNIILK